MVRYPIDAKFGTVIKVRGLSVVSLAGKLGTDSKTLLDALNGVTPFGTIGTFKDLDRIYHTTPGYFEGVYENCRRSVEAERANEVSSPATVTIPVDMLQSLYDIACEHGYPMFDVCEVLTKHKKDNP